MTGTILTYRYRLKDSQHSDRIALRKQASAVNFVWNYCCQIQREAERRWKAGCSREASRWPTHFDLTHLTAGCTKELGLHSETVGAICRVFAGSRNKLKHCPRWRSARKNLDWVPVDHAESAIKIRDCAIQFRGRPYRLWWSRDLPSGATIKTASFSCDARGRWYINVVVRVPITVDAVIRPAVGIDLGLKSLATLSDGRKIEMPSFYRRTEAELGRYQRFGQKRRATALAAKAANQRKDFLHKASTGLVLEFGRIVIGDVSPSRLAKTRMAKSIHDAGWAMLREQLRYKALRHGVAFEVVNEAWTSRTCSACGSIPASSPKGMGALGIREWRCDDCGAVHDRDVNAARNILLGVARRPPAAGIAQ